MLAVLVVLVASVPDMMVQALVLALAQDLGLVVQDLELVVQDLGLVVQVLGLVVQGLEQVQEVQNN